MICVAISDKNPEKCLKILDKVEMAEIRLDLTGYDLSVFEKVFSHSTPTVATCRAEVTGFEIQSVRLIKAIEAGASYVDIEIEVPEEQSKAIIDCARKHNCKVIISYHNFNETPGLQDIFSIVDECYKRGADIAKVATMVNSDEDNARLMALYSGGKPLVSLGMGEIGKKSRIIAPLLGAEFTFASQDDGASTAPGQIEYSKMKSILEGLKDLY